MSSPSNIWQSFVLTKLLASIRPVKTLVNTAQIWYTVLDLPLISFPLIYFLSEVDRPRMLTPTGDDQNKLIYRGSYMLPLVTITR